MAVRLFMEEPRILARLFIEETQNIGKLRVKAQTYAYTIEE